MVFWYDITLCKRVRRQCCRDDPRDLTGVSALSCGYSMDMEVLHHLVQPEAHALRRYEYPKPKFPAVVGATAGFSWGTEVRSEALLATSGRPVVERRAAVEAWAW